MSTPPAPQISRRRRRLLLLAAVLGAAVIAGGVLLTRDGPLPDPPPSVLDPGGPDPFAYREDRRAAFERRAAAGLSHVLFAKSPGGAVASARRSARWRGAIERATEGTDVDPDDLEAIVFLESAGRPDAVATDLDGAVGLTQILADTGQGLLALRVDVAASRKLTKQIAKARRSGRERRADALAARRRRVDERFDPGKALRATVRYLEFARGRLGREDLAVVSYHMGVGNLQQVIDDFDAGPRPSYARLFFDSAPDRHEAAYRRLAGLGDDSRTYYWRVLGARAILDQARRDPGRLAELADLSTAKNSDEERLHPEHDTDVYDDPGELESALRDGQLLPFPDAPRKTGLRRDRQMGELAPRLQRSRRLYRALRPGAYALALYMDRLTREAGGGGAPLTITSTVRDREYQRLLSAGNPEATDGYSLHTTGWAFDVLRDYSSPKQAQAFQFALDRLQALGLIAWVREPRAIHVTVSGDADRLRALLREAGD